MIVPIKWLKEYVDIKKSPKDIADSFTALGLMLDRPIENEILDLEHRMDRSDWLSIMGCARDLAAMEGLKLKYPEMYKEKGKEISEEDKVKIEVKCPDLVHRFNTRVFKNVEVKESPKWLRERLEEYGIPSKNNIVDITNYVMVEFGQPMHAQDIDKMEAKEIVIRRAREGEKVKTLLGETIELDEDTFVLTQANKPTVIGGIVGGMATAVDENTKNIVLDSGNYDQTTVRKTSRRLKIQNETVLRYDKFLHPKACEIAIERATKLILDLAGGEYYENEDYYPKVWDLNEKTLTMARLKKISGVDFKINRVKEILTALEYEIISETADKLVLKVPYFRTDVEVEDDLIADVLRVNNYNNLPVTQISAAPPKEITPKIYKFEEKLRDTLVNIGLHEHITSPLIKADGSEGQVILENALNSEQNALRTSLYGTLSKVVENYEKHGKKEIKVFEIGREYFTKGENYEDYFEVDVTQINYWADVKSYELNKGLKEIVSRFLFDLGIKNPTYKEAKEKDLAEVYVDKSLIGQVGYDYATFYNNELLKLNIRNIRVASGYKNIITEDVTVDFKLGESAGHALELLNNKNIDILSKVEVVKEYKKDENTKSITFRLYFSSVSDKNLTLEEVQKAKNKLVSNL